MAVKTYWMRFGSGDPRTFTGLAPTFLIFANQAGAAQTAPAVTEVPASSGIYQFSWGTTTPIAFLADAATTSPGTSGRYVVGSLDPADTTDWFGTTAVALGITGIALGTTGVALGVSGIAQGVSLAALGVTILAAETNQGVTLVAIGNTLSAIGLTVGSGFAGIGSTASSYGSSTQDPVDLFGYMKRIQENLEGNNTYIKGTGTLNIYSRASATLLIAKTIANSVTTVIKT